MVLVNREALAWAAGFFDGEGHARNTGSAGGGTTLVIHQNNREELERFRAAVFGIGTITGPHKYASNPKARSPYYVYRVTDGAQVQAIIAALWTYLGTTKRKQAAGALANAKWKTPGFCDKGHNKDRLGRRADGRCAECCRIQDRVRHVPMTARGRRGPYKLKVDA